ncbi:MAG: peptide-methionine (R)-S-oxide reductase MsrB [Alphaproteobacteria bacterium]
MNRRIFLRQLAVGSTIFITTQSHFMEYLMAADNNDPILKITKTDAQWRQELPPESYQILRHEGTERAFTSPLNEEKRHGTFVCAGCGLPLFSSNTKYNSGTGWPSFFQAIPGHVETTTDYKIGVARTEYRCARCGGHQGHVFDDGPAPTGLRYCNNGLALRFIEEK